LCLISFTSLPGQKVLSLEESIKIALDKSLLLQQSNNSIKLAEISETEAKHNQYPNVSGNSGLNFNFGRSVDPTSNQFVNETFITNNYAVNSGILLFNGFRLKNILKQSKIDRAAAKADYLQDEADIALQVASIYLNGLFAKENISFSNNQLTQIQDQLSNINKLINAGVRPKNESLEIEAQIASGEQNLLAAENALISAKLQLKQLLRLDPKQDIDLTVPAEPEDLKDVDLITFDLAYEEALEYQPSIRAAKLRENSASIGIEIAESAFYPSLTLGGSLNTAYSNKGVNILPGNLVRSAQPAYINGELVILGFDQPGIESASWGSQVRDNLSFGFGLNLNVPIYNNQSGKLNKQRSELNLISSQIATEQIKQSVQTLVLQALTDAKNAKKALAASEKTKEARDAAWENAKKQYNAGALNSFDLSNVQSQYELASINYLQEKYNYIFRVIILDYYMGKPVK